MIIQPRITGLVAAPFTPFDRDGRVNPDAIEAQARSLLRNDVRGAFICGTTGEGMSLTTAERMLVAERWRKVADRTLRIMVHVGHNAIDDSRALAAHAQQIGADAIGCMAPFFFKPARVEELVDFCAQIAAAAPQLPFYYYHIPSMTGVQIPAVDFLKLAAGRIPNLAGIKFTSENLVDYAECLRFNNGQFEILFGRDELLLPSLAVGARGAIGSTYNFAAPIYIRVMNAFEQGALAEAQAEQARANEMIAALIRFGGLPAMKAMMKLIGVDCGAPRLPLRGLTPAKETELRQALEQIRFFDFCSRAD